MNADQERPVTAHVGWIQPHPKTNVNAGSCKSGSAHFDAFDGEGRKVRNPKSAPRQLNPNSEREMSKLDQTDVGQAFQPAGSPDFPVRCVGNGRLESRPYRQAGKPALRWRQPRQLRRSGLTKPCTKPLSSRPSLVRARPPFTGQCPPDQARHNCTYEQHQDKLQPQPEGVIRQRLGLGAGLPA